MRAAQMQQLFAASNASLATNILLAAILAYAMRSVVGIATIAAWFGFTTLAALSRAALVGAYRRSPGSGDAAHTWLRIFRLCVLATGAAWGLGGLLLFPSQHPQYQMLLVFMLAGLTAGGIVSFAADWASVLAFPVLTIAPLSIRLLAAGDGLSVAMGMGGTLYLAFMVASARRMNRHIQDNIALHLESSAREESAKANEERHRLLLDHAPVGIFQYDSNLVITYCNDRLAGLLGNSVEGLVGLDMKLLQDKTILPVMKEVLVGKISHYEGHYRATFGNFDGWVFITCAPFRDENGALTGGIAIVQDLTEHKRIEDALNDSKALLRTAQHAARMGHYQTDLRTGTWTNDAMFDEIFGIDEHFVRDFAHWQNIMHPDDCQHVMQVYQQSLDNHAEDLAAVEYRIVRPSDGATRWIAGWGCNFYDRQGNPIQQVGIIQDITKRKVTEEEIQNLAFYDPLTRLPNRRLLLDRLNQALASGARSGRAGALLFIDLDNFKNLNDTLGHDVGDLLLQQVAARLTACVREGDTVARLGGDEFVVMLEDLSNQDLEAAAQTETVGEKILATLSQPYQLGPHDYHNTPSIGIALFSNYQQGVEDLLKQADIAMYQAKKAGRNTLRFFDPQMQASITARATLERELRKALENRQFLLHYQIQMDSSHRPLGAEALIRWQHPELGLVSPEVFIPLAEETGLIFPIGQWVLETACDQIKQWEDSALTCDLQLAVNVSQRQFHQAQFVEQVRQILSRSAIKPDRLKLELTESMVMDDVDDTVLKVSELREVGVRFSMDDFGTGHSSLSNLKKLPLDQLKIDQSFVRDITIDPDDAVIVQTIIVMAHNLGMEVIAEGVETEAQRAFLEQHGCPAFQGYLFSKPLPLEEFEQLLQDFAA